MRDKRRAVRSPQDFGGKMPTGVSRLGKDPVIRAILPDPPLGLTFARTLRALTGRPLYGESGNLLRKNYKPASLTPPAYRRSDHKPRENQQLYQNPGIRKSHQNTCRQLFETHTISMQNSRNPSNGIEKT